MTMPKAIGLLVLSILVAAAGIFLVFLRVESGILSREIEERSSGARVGDNPATPEGTGYQSSGSAGAAVTAAVRQVTAIAATANAVLTPVPSTPGTGASGTVAIGESIEVNGSRYTVHQVVDPEPPGLFPTNAGSRRVAMEVTQQALTARQTYSMSFFKLLDTDGQEHSWAITNSTPAFQTGQLQPGESRRGWISFQVPVGATLDALEVTIFGQPRAVPIVSLR